MIICHYENSFNKVLAIMRTITINYKELTESLAKLERDYPSRMHGHIDLLRANIRDNLMQFLSGDTLTVELDDSLGMAYINGKPIVGHVYAIYDHSKNPTSAEKIYEQILEAMKSAKQLGFDENVFICKTKWNKDMGDKSLYTNQSREISDGLQNFIDSMVEEIVLEGKPFNTQKKYLKKFSENESLDYEKLEADLSTFIEILENLKNVSNDLMEKLAIEKGTDSYISFSVVKKLLGKFRTPKLFLVQNGISGKYNYIDTNGNIVLSDDWVDAWDFSEGLAAVAKSIPGEPCWRYGYIDLKGEYVLPLQWGNAESFHEGLAVVANDEGDHGYINKMGQLVIPCKYGSAGYFCDGLAPVWDNFICQGGYIDKNGKIVIPQKEDWDDILEFREGLALVRNKNKKWGYVDTKGTIVIPFEWEKVGWFGEGYAPVWNAEGKCGYIDKKGKIVIPFHEEWESAGWFSEGLAPVKKQTRSLGIYR